jgi:hypothetical protein
MWMGALTFACLAGAAFAAEGAGPEQVWDGSWNIFIADAASDYTFKVGERHAEFQDGRQREILAIRAGSELDWAAAEELLLKRTVPEAAGSSSRPRKRARTLQSSCDEGVEACAQWFQVAPPPVASRFDADITQGENGEAVERQQGSLFTLMNLPPAAPQDTRYFYTVEWRQDAGAWTPGGGLVRDVSSSGYSVKETWVLYPEWYGSESGQVPDPSAIRLRKVSGNVLFSRLSTIAETSGQDDWYRFDHPWDLLPSSRPLSD